MIIYMTILALLMGLFAGAVGPLYIARFVTIRRQKREIETMMPGDVDHQKLCIRHDWVEATSVNEKLEYVPIKICKGCGFIPSKNKMLPAQGIKNMIEGIKHREQEEALQKEFVEEENARIQKFLKNEINSGLTMEKVNEIYHAGQTATKRYMYYKMGISEQNESGPKGNA